MKLSRIDLRAALGNERGSTAVLIALAMTGMLSMAALAVDVGMLFTARSEAQRVADAAALTIAGPGIPDGEPSGGRLGTLADEGFREHTRKEPGEVYVERYW